MARVTTEDCLDQVKNRFLLVQLATRRARDLMRGSTATISCDNKELVTGLREIAAGHVAFDGELEEILKLPIHIDRNVQLSDF